MPSNRVDAGSASARACAPTGSPPGGSLSADSAETMPMSFSDLDFRAALGTFATGVTIVTSVDSQGAPVGVTINSFTSVSLAPPLVLFCLGRAAQTFAIFSACSGFAVNVLAERQEALSSRFAQPDAAARWDGIPYDRSPLGHPLLRDCLATLDCRLETVHEGGDHIILVGRVETLAVAAEDRPLLYYRGRYATLGGFDAPDPKGWI